MQDKIPMMYDIHGTDYATAQKRVSKPPSTLGPRYPNQTKNWILDILDGNYPSFLVEVKQYFDKMGRASYLEHATFHDSAI